MAKQWGKLYGDLHDHPKMRRARKGGDRPRDASAIGLWVCAESWCIDNFHTDGWVPAEELDRWDSNAEILAQRLVDANLWVAEERDGEPGFQFWQWTDHQESAEKINAKREKNRVRMANNRGTSPSPAPRPKATPKPKPEPADDGGFDEFWAAYPKKQSKKTAQTAYAKARKSAPAETIMKGLVMAKAMWQGKDPQFIPHAATWLNGGRWEDEPLNAAPSDDPQPTRTILRQCRDNENHDRHEWTDMRNVYLCQGIQDHDPADPWAIA
ncbi:hypothetical protein SAMN05428985_11079 [Nocardioides sp. YR527]|uniref:hypothetical protein n=1 Tax=Nocardioides sp. YR527 TaxID=1881028 RepID=UPI00088936FD|nr:hypothetical protein [Nocardioides sp. YR527]SDL15262.1 hypothetical protein SAMN05428985_11079 [Nocardioides sp. YR527]